VQGSKGIRQGGLIPLYKCWWAVRKMHSIESGRSMHVTPFFSSDVVAGSCPVAYTLSRRWGLSIYVNHINPLSPMEERLTKSVVYIERNTERKEALSIAQAARPRSISMKRKIIHGENNEHVRVRKARYVRYTIAIGAVNSTGFPGTDWEYAVTPHEHTKCGIPHARFSRVDKRAGFELDRA
jgi:hypothetical protein